MTRNTWELKFKSYNLYTFKKQVDANCIDLDSEFVDLNFGQEVKKPCEITRNKGVSILCADDFF